MEQLMHRSSTSQMTTKLNLENESFFAFISSRFSVIWRSLLNSGFLCFVLFQFRLGREKILLLTLSIKYTLLLVFCEAFPQQMIQ